MSFIDIVLAILLLAISLVILRWFLAALATPLLPVLKDWQTKMVRSRNAGMLKSFQDRIASRDGRLRDSELQKHFYVSNLPGNRDESKRWQEHNKRALALLRELPSHDQESLKFIDTCEELLFEREKLLKIYADTQDTLQGLQQKKGKSGPEWATAEFEKRLNECCEDLKGNSIDFLTVVKRIIDRGNRIKPDESNDITFH
jgi:hypothetical protein